MEIFAKIFLFCLIIGMAGFGIYAAYRVDTIREKWRKEGKSEWQVRADFYDRDT